MPITRTAALFVAGVLSLSACGSTATDTNAIGGAPASLAFDATNEAAAPDSDAPATTVAPVTTDAPATTAAPTTAAPTTAAPTTAAPTTVAPTTTAAPLTMFGTVGLPEFGVSCADLDRETPGMRSLDAHFNYGGQYESIVGDGFAGDDIYIFASIPGEALIASTVNLDIPNDFLMVMRYDSEPIVLARGDAGFDAMYDALDGRFSDETIGKTEASVDRTNAGFTNCQEWDLGPVMGGGM